MHPASASNRSAAEQLATDQCTEQAMGNLLRTGVSIAAGVVFIGGCLYLWQAGRHIPDYAEFRAEPPELRSIGGTVRGALAGDGRSIIQLGMLLLVATPISRVAFSIWAFARQQDRRYVLVTLLVLSILCYGLVHGYLEQSAH
jgi:uncharacterized membrane protein